MDAASTSYIGSTAPWQQNYLSPLPDADRLTKLYNSVREHSAQSSLKNFTLTENNILVRPQLPSPQNLLNIKPQMPLEAFQPQYAKYDNLVKNSLSTLFDLKEEKPAELGKRKRADTRLEISERLKELHSRCLIEINALESLKYQMHDIGPAAKKMKESASLIYDSINLIDLRCRICSTSETPKWRKLAGQDGICCNTCGLRIKRDQKRAKAIELK